jgi:hypothetical protein
VKTGGSVDHGRTRVDDRTSLIKVGVGRRWGSSIWLHILFGPPVAVAAGVLYWRDTLGAPFPRGEDVASQIISYLFFGIVGLVTGYMFGLVPCIMHFVVMLLLSRGMRSRLIWCGNTAHRLWIQCRHPSLRLPRSSFVCWHHPSSRTARPVCSDGLHAVVL